MSDHRTIAYLTSAYARATDTFIRDEVTQLRASGDTVLTFSIRKPATSEVVNDAIAAERAATTYLLDLPRTTFLIAAAAALARSPSRFGRALRTAAELARPGFRARLWPLFYFLEACVLSRELRRGRVDHLHNHFGEGSASVAMLASILSGVPFSFTVHGPSEWDAPSALALDVKARHASFVATISQFTRGETRRWVEPEDWEKVQVVRCGVDPQTGADLVREEPTTPTLVSVGRLAHEKGHLVLLRALRELAPSEPLSVVIVGDGPERARLETYARQHRLDHVVEFVGWRTSDEVRAIVGAGTALVMPSFAEGLPVSIMEAYALGRPVISSDVGGIAELVEPGHSGWLVPSGSTAALTAALRDLLGLSPEQRQAMGARGRERVRTDHDSTVEVSRLRSLIHGSRPRS